MKVSREQVAENREQILQAASQLFRERGFDAVSVAEIMNAAGLTHGGFYGYFTSKEDLIVQALRHALARIDGADQPAPRDTRSSLARYIHEYLSPRHRDDSAGGCPTAALAAETARTTVEARAALTEGLQRQLERFAALASGSKPQRRRAAIATWSAMVGALVLARLSTDRTLSDELLEQTRLFARDHLRLKPTR